MTQRVVVTANDTGPEGGAQGTGIHVQSLLVGGNQLDENSLVFGVQRAFINASTTGDSEIIASQGPSIRIRVLGVSVFSPVTLSVIFRDTSTSISGLFHLAANTGFILPFNPHGWFQTEQDSALNINLNTSATAGVGVNVVALGAL